MRLDALTKLFLVVALLLFRVEGQEKSGARLVDEFSRVSCCCDLGGRMDAFFTEIAANPGSTGYIVLSDSQKPQVLWREKYFDGYAEMRGIDPTRFLIVRRPGVIDPFHTQMWIVPPGAKMLGEFTTEFA